MDRGSWDLPNHVFDVSRLVRGQIRIGGHGTIKYLLICPTPDSEYTWDVLVIPDYVSSRGKKFNVSHVWNQDLINMPLLGVTGTRENSHENRNK